MTRDRSDIPKSAKRSGKSKTPRSKGKLIRNVAKIFPMKRGSFDDPKAKSIVGTCDPKLFKIRSKMYKKTRKKTNSSDDMYEFLNMYSFQSSNRSFDNIIETGNLNLPEPPKDLKARCSDCGVRRDAVFRKTKIHIFFFFNSLLRLSLPLLL